jgi:hypothetical protein
MLKIDEMTAKKVPIFDDFFQISKMRPLNVLRMTRHWFIQLDLLVRIPNLQSESKNVGN